MLRRKWLLAQVSLLGVLGVLAFPGDGLALRAAFITLTSTGPSPSVLRIPAGMYPVWTNQDTVSHTVTFAGGCSVEVTPGGYGQCSDGGPGNVVGNYPYTVDGTDQGSVKVDPDSRDVTLTAKHHWFRRGAKVLLRGHLSIEQLSPPTRFGPRMPVTVYERPRGHHLWYRLAVVTAKPLEKGTFPPYSVWQLSVRPHDGTTYKVEASSQPKAGKFWMTAWSKPFRLYLRR